ncbi:MAG: hypothetical protein ACI4OJ_07505, partial [Lachnospiraceae bacterium]
RSCQKPHGFPGLFFSAGAGPSLLSLTRQGGSGTSIGLSCHIAGFGHNISTSISIFPCIFKNNRKIWLINH